MKKIEICGLCKKQIDTKKDDFVHLTDYKAGKFFMEGFYHAKCYNDSVGGAKDMKKAAFGLLKRAGSIMDNLDGGKKVYEIPR